MIKWNIINIISFLNFINDFISNKTSKEYQITIEDYLKIKEIKSIKSVINLYKNDLEIKNNIDIFNNLIVSCVNLIINLSTIFWIIINKIYYVIKIFIYWFVVELFLKYQNIF